MSHLYENSYKMEFFVWLETCKTSFRKSLRSTIPPIPFIFYGGLTSSKKLFMFVEETQNTNEFLWWSETCESSNLLSLDKLISLHILTSLLNFSVSLSLSEWTEVSSGSPRKFGEETVKKTGWLLVVSCHKRFFFHIRKLHNWSLWLEISHVYAWLG